MKKRLIDAMVNAFLGWPLPKDFAPDCYINFDREKATVTPHCWPVGTNLFTADQARQMFEHVVDKGIGLPTTEQPATILSRFATVPAPPPAGGANLSKPATYPMTLPKFAATGDSVKLWSYKNCA